MVVTVVPGKPRVCFRAADFSIGRPNPLDALSPSPGDVVRENASTTQIARTVNLERFSHASTFFGVSAIVEKEEPEKDQEGGAGSSYKEGSTWKWAMVSFKPSPRMKRMPSSGQPPP